MRAVLTRVARASVSIGGQPVGSIGRGFLVLLGVAPDDDAVLCRRLAEKLCSLRIFEDENGKMNRGLAEVGGSLLVVSQFTLFASCRKGRRPDFFGAAPPETAIPLYEQFLCECEVLGFQPQHGVFGADMQVESVNDGPVTILLDTDTLFPDR